MAADANRAAVASTEMPMLDQLEFALCRSNHAPPTVGGRPW